jgi:copper resistance protein B
MNKIRKKILTKPLLVSILLILGTQTSWSNQENQHSNHQASDQKIPVASEPTEHQGIKNGDTKNQEMNHEGMKHKDMKDESVDINKMNHEGMNHDEMSGNNSVMPNMTEIQKDEMGEMQPQGGDAPANARDPHAYSNGYTLTEGPYAMPKENRLKLADEHSFAALLGNRLEYDNSSNSITYDFQAWYGTTFDRLVVKAEGDIIQGNIEESQTDVLWGHAVSTFWDAQIGVRLDSYDEGKNRQWVALGLQGLAPYWFELDMTAYVGKSGNTALTVEAEYELLLTQKLIFQPRTEISLYGKDDLQNNLGSGFSSSSIGFRLRYEFSRQFAPYLGVEWVNQYGKTADFAQLQGNDTSDTKILAGIRFWF